MSNVIYVSGPYSGGDMALNVRDAINTGNILLELGLVPIIPHLTHFWHMLFPHNYAMWLAYDIEVMKKCDAVYRMPGDSSGADIEVKEAQEIGIPVFYTMDEVRQWRV